MANANFYLCDVCGNRVPQDQRLVIPVGRGTDGAGSTETEYATVDLCAKHMHRVLQHITSADKRPFEANLELVKFIKSMKD